MNNKGSLNIILIGLVAFILAACGSNSNVAEETTAAPDTNEEDHATKLEGKVEIDGSGTVYPLMDKLATEYMINEQENVTVEVSRAGRSAGFERFLSENGTDFNDASREIKAEEVTKAEELGIEVKELKVALDGLTFVIHPDNDWATEMTAEDLKNIFLADGGMTSWSDIDSEWPAEEIQAYGPNENHGTYEFFYEELLEQEQLAETVILEQEYPTLVQQIADDVNGIAFFGFGYYVNNQDTLQAVHVDFGSGPVEPSLETIAEDGDYADFTRPVFTYLNVNRAKEQPQVLDFANYVLNRMNDFAGETGFAPIPEEEVNDNLEFLEGLH